MCNTIMGNNTFEFTLSRGSLSLYAFPPVAFDFREIWIIYSGIAKHKGNESYGTSAYLSINHDTLPQASREDPLGVYCHHPVPCAVVTTCQLKVYARAHTRECLCGCA